MTVAVQSAITAAFNVPSTELYFRAIDQARNQHEYLTLEASLAPPVTHHSGCVCGAVLEIRGSRQDYTDDDYQAITEFADSHSYCQ